MEGDRARVAVTSRDGVSVNERFHRALDYLVFEVDLNLLREPVDGGAEAIRFVERRPRPDPEARVFRDFETLAELLRDCGVIVSLAFTGAARKAFAGKGFAIEEARGAIPAVLRELLSQAAPDEGRAEPPSSRSEPSSEE